MICPKCNKDIDLKDVYCSLCGYKIFQKKSRQRFFFGEIYTDRERESLGKIPGKYWFPIIMGLTGGKSILISKVYFLTYLIIFFLFASPLILFILSLLTKII